MQGTEARWVVWILSVISVNGHGTITLVRVEGLQGTVHRDLLVVDTKTVTLGVGIREETRLEDRVRRRLNARDHVRRRECGLLHLGEIVLWVLVQGEFTEAAERNFALRPDLGKIENIPAELLCLFRAQDLHVSSPGRVLSSFNGVEQVLGVPIRVLSSDLSGLLVIESLDALVSEKVDLDIVEAAVRLQPFVGMTGIAVHVSVRVRGAAVREQCHDLMSRLLMGG